MNLLLERIELRPGRPTPIRRRLIRAQRLTNRVPRQARPPHQLLDRHAVHEVLPTQPSPILHADQPFPPDPIAVDRASFESPADGFATRPGGQFSTGEGGSVFSRRRQRCAARSARVRVWRLRSRSRTRLRIGTRLRLPGPAEEDPAAAIDRGPFASTLCRGGRARRCGRPSLGAGARWYARPSPRKMRREALRGGRRRLPESRRAGPASVPAQAPRRRARATGRGLCSARSSRHCRGQTDPGVPALASAISSRSTKDK